MSCCPSVWWCSPTGPIEVAADGNGAYSRPAGASGHPFKSLEDALEVCPPPPVPLPCPSCETPYQMPAEFVISFVNTTGDVEFPNSVAVPLVIDGYNCNYSSAGACYRTAIDPNSINTVTLNAVCQEDGSLKLAMSVFVDANPGVGGTSKEITSFTPAGDWVLEGVSTLTKTIACGDPVDLSGFLGRAEFSGLDTTPPSPRTGFADIYLTS